MEVLKLPKIPSFNWPNTVGDGNEVLLKFHLCLLKYSKKSVPAEHNFYNSLMTWHEICHLDNNLI
ncbi:hypothetical protein DPMN_108942 [Dreissena polymorpha]|uniref:Uncharacterized protein n=1 Tax=Dreissena polymorpha TaxID=45954 RepID=A0A9D4KA27_DREPO|nr:hypothetical protein DPMN_108942 [Dreissena polymorpha]